jgi:hypothetical protein
MKKSLLVLVIPVMLLAAGCNQKEKAEIAQLKATNDSLVMVGNAKDSTVIEFVNAFNDIQSNLDTIKMKEKIINKAFEGNSELKHRSKDQIISDINVIYKMQQKNRALVADLRVKLKKAGEHTAELQSMVDNLTIQIAEKDAQIAQLQEDLTKENMKVQDLTAKVGTLNSDVADLSSQNQQKQQVIEAKTSELNTAYYVMGTTRELKDKKIITKEGGFIGLGRSKDIAPAINPNELTRVDITKLTTLPIMKDKVTILSKHPLDSYYITGKNAADSLVITNPTEFWSMSKVLVLNVK